MGTNTPDQTRCEGRKAWLLLGQYIFFLLKYITLVPALAKELSWREKQKTNQNEMLNLLLYFHNQVQIKMRATKKKLKIQNVQYLAVLSRENLGYYILNQDIFSIFFQHTHNLILLEIEYSSTTTATGI